MTAFPHRTKTGFTLIELVMSLAILALLATMVMPMGEVAVQRDKEQALRTSLRQIRDAIDAYKQAYDEGHILKTVDSSGYPPTLDVLVDGVKDARSPDEKMIYFLRRLPRDPLSHDPNMSAAETWGKRSYASSFSDPQEGDDVFDIYTLASGNGLNGVPYREW
jgi:general secretion pathway protein G